VTGLESAQGNRRAEPYWVRMPFTSRLFLKTGIFYLIITFIAGTVLLVLEATGRPAPFIISVEHGHAGFVGWLLNTVIGVALWLLPLNRQRFPESQGRYPKHAARTSFYLLNIGLALRLFCEPWFDSTHYVIASTLLIIAAILQLAGIAVVAWILWQRIFAPPLRSEI
jgi:hypothetical protein